MLRIIRRSLPLSLLIAVTAVTAAAADTVHIGINTSGNGAAVQLTPSGRPAGCKGPRCFYAFERGTTVNITATPGRQGSRFVRWIEGCNHAFGTCKLRMDQNQSLTAHFSPVAVYADRVTDGTVAVSPLGRSCGFRCWLYDYGAVVTLSAQAAADYAFYRWYGPCGGQGSVCRLTALEPIDALPDFRCTADACSITQPIERVVETKVIVKGRGSVQVNKLRCASSSVCRYKFRRGLALQLVANGSSPKWSGACELRSRNCQFTAIRGPDGKPPVVTADFR